MLDQVLKRQFPVPTHQDRDCGKGDDDRERGDAPKSNQMIG
jgi:hypothetical protein